MKSRVGVQEMCDAACCEEHACLSLQAVRRSVSAALLSASLSVSLCVPLLEAFGVLLCFPLYTERISPRRAWHAEQLYSSAAVSERCMMSHLRFGYIKLPAQCCRGKLSCRYYRVAFRHLVKHEAYVSLFHDEQVFV